MQKLQEMTVKEYLEVLGSGAPAPGGGSAAALSGAQGCALGAMVMELTIGKKKYLEHTERLTVTRDALKALAAELMQDIDRDTQAYDAVSAAMKLPKETEAEQETRRAAIQQALLGATLSPLNVLHRTLEGLAQLKGLEGHFNVNAASDIGTGAAMLRAAAQGAWLNILINLGGIKDAEKVARLRAEGEQLYRDALMLADAVFADIEKLCMP